VSSNRDGVGAVVTVTAGGRTQTRMVRTGSTYLSQSDRAVLFGLADADMVNEVTIRWPSGRLDRLTNVRANQRITATEGVGDGR
jgi:hypothetical protein